MTVLTKTFFPLVGSHLVTLMLLSVWHSPLVFRGSLFIVNYFTFAAKLLAGLKAGMLCSGMVMVVFFEMLRATFLARFFTMKLPNPRRYTLFS